MKKIKEEARKSTSLPGAVRLPPPRPPTPPPPELDDTGYEVKAAFDLGDMVHRWAYYMDTVFFAPPPPPATARPSTEGEKEPSKEPAPVS